MPTLQTYRRTAARLLGPYQQGTATAGSSTTQLEDTTWPLKSSTTRSAAYKDWFLFRPNAAAVADKVRWAKLYTPSTGKIDVDNTYGTAIANGEVYELHGLIEPYTDFRQLINDVLNLPQTMVLTELTFTVSSNLNRRHSLATAAPWLTDPDWVYQVGILPSGQTRTQYDPFSAPYRGTVRKDGATVYLEGFSANTTDTVYVLVARPAYTYCKPTAGAFGDQSGLTATETDEAVPDDVWVGWGVAMLYWDQRLKHSALADRPHAQAEFVRALSNWRAATDANFVPPMRTFRPLRYWGPVSSGRFP